MSKGAAGVLEVEGAIWGFQLIHELCEIGEDARRWRNHFLEELRRKLDVALAAAYVMKVTLDPADAEPRMPLYVDIGANEAWNRWMAEGDYTADPVTPQIMRRFGTDFTCTRQDLVDDATWYASAHYHAIYKPANWDQILYSQVGIHPPGVVDGIGLVRTSGKPPFSPREVELVRLIHQELARLWRRPDAVGMQILPARQRGVLQCIREGASRRHIAEKMGISEHTVHDYEKALFVRAGVSSRTELLALMAKRICPVLLP
jgi:DNA-binding CsgD family transcriptional regulator